MRLVAIEQFQVQIAPGFIGEALEKLTGEAETEGAGHVLGLFRRSDSFEGQFIHPTPNQAGTAAEINDATAQAFIDWHKGLACKGGPGGQTEPVAAGAPCRAP